MWLDPDLTDLAELQSLLVPAPDPLLAAYPVERLVNDVHNDGPALIAPIAEEPTLFGAEDGAGRARV